MPSAQTTPQVQQLAVLGPVPEPAPGIAAQAGAIAGNAVVSPRTRGRDATSSPFSSGKGNLQTPANGDSGSSQQSQPVPGDKLPSPQDTNSITQPTPQASSVQMFSARTISQARQFAAASTAPKQSDGTGAAAAGAGAIGPFPLNASANIGSGSPQQRQPGPGDGSQLPSMVDTNAAQPTLQASDEKALSALAAATPAIISTLSASKISSSSGNAASNLQAPASSGSEGLQQAQPVHRAENELPLPQNADASVPPTPQPLASELLSAQTASPVQQVAADGLAAQQAGAADAQAADALIQNTNIPANLQAAQPDRLAGAGGKTAVGRPRGPELGVGSSPSPVPQPTNTAVPPNRVPATEQSATNPQPQDSQSGAHGGLPAPGGALTASAPAPNGQPANSSFDVAAIGHLPTDAAQAGLSPRDDTAQAHTMAQAAMPTAESHTIPEQGNQVVLNPKVLESVQQAEMKVGVQPEGLGPIEIHATLRGDEIGASISAQQSDTRQWLTSHMSDLAQTLDTHNLRLSNLSVSETFAGSSVQSGFSQSDAQGQTYQQRQPAFYAGEQAVETPTITEDDLTGEHVHTGVDLQA